MARKFETRDTTQRSHRITCRLSDDEWEQLQIVTEALGLTCSEYVRSVLLTSRISRPTLEVKGDSATLQQIAAQLGKIGSNVNQIARHLNQGLVLAQPEEHELMDCIGKLEEVLEKLSQKAG